VKESKFLDERVNRMQLAFFVAHINRLFDIHIFKNQHSLEYVNLIF
jgi:hypothetical protein